MISFYKSYQVKCIYTFNNEFLILQEEHTGFYLNEFEFINNQFNKFTYIKNLIFLSFNFIDDLVQLDKNKIIIKNGKEAIIWCYKEYLEKEKQKIENKDKNNDNSFCNIF